MFIEDASFMETVDGMGTANDFAEAKRTSDLVEGGMQFAKASNKGATPFSGFFDLLAPLGLVNGIDDLINGDSWTDQVGGGLDTVAGGAGTLELLGLEAAGPVGMVAGAGAAGWSVGTNGNALARKWGYLGENEDGEHKTLSEAWGDIAFNSSTSQSAGPALVAAGGMAVVNNAIDPWLELAGVEAPISSKQQREMNQASNSTFDKMRQSGMSEAAAETLAAQSNPQFRDNRERERQRATILKSGLPPAVANMLAGEMT